MQNIHTWLFTRVDQAQCLDNRLISCVALEFEGGNCIFAASFFLTLFSYFLLVTLIHIQYTNRKRNQSGRITFSLSPILYICIVFFSLDFIYYFIFILIGFVSFGELSPVNNDNNDQHQIQVANTIVSQPTSTSLRYYIQCWSLA